jgi:hypothetical protein
VADVNAALLCDFAQVRDGLLFVASGGIDRLYRPELPASMGVYLALVLGLGPDEIGDRVHEVRATIQHVSTGQIVAEADGGIEVGKQGAVVDETSPVNAPLVIPLLAVAVSLAGRHEISVSVDSGRPTLLSFTVVGDVPPTA